MPDICQSRLNFCCHSTIDCPNFLDQCPRKDIKHQKFRLFTFLDLGITEICRRNGSPVNLAKSGGMVIKGS